jgi:hypothetical protein
MVPIVHQIEEPVVPVFSKRTGEPTQTLVSDGVMRMPALGRTNSKSSLNISALQLLDWLNG